MVEGALTQRSNLSFDEGVIEKMAGLAARKVSGILSFDGGMIGNLADKLRSRSDPTQGISAEVGESQVTIEMTATIEYGHDIREIFNQVCTNVQDEIKRMTGLQVIELNFHVNNVMSKKEWKENNSGQPNSELNPDEKG